MLSQGNGTREQCASNLIKTLRGETPFERLKGLDRALIDSPSFNVASVKAGVSWLISTYEKRIDRFEIGVVASDSKNGAFDVNLIIE